MRCTARRTIVMLAGALTLCTTMISARGTGLGDDVGGVLAATSVETTVTPNVVGGQSVSIYWLAVAGVCGSCLVMVALGHAPFGTIATCAHVCSLVWS